MKGDDIVAPGENGSQPAEETEKQTIEESDVGSLEDVLGGAPSSPTLSEAAPSGHPRPLDVTDCDDATAKVPDTVTHGDPDLWKCLCKESSVEQGWMKSTKAMATPHGVLVQVTTEHRANDGDIEVVTAAAEALVFIPSVQLLQDHESGLWEIV